MNRVFFVNQISEASLEKGLAGARRVEHLLNSIPICEVVSVICSNVTNDAGFIQHGYRKEVSNRTYQYLPNLNCRYLRAITSAVFLFAYLLRNAEPTDVVLTYNFTPFIAFPVLTAKLFKRFKLIIDYEELYSKIYKKSLAGFFEKLGIRSADAFIACSRIISSNLEKYRKPVCVSSGYSFWAEEFSANSNLDTSGHIHQDPFVLYSGRLDKIGGIMNLIQAFFEASPLEAKLVITGSGPETSHIERIATENKKVLFLGNVSMSELKVLLSKDCVCVNPIDPTSSYSTFSFSSKVTWWLSMGKVVLSTEARSVIDSDFSGFLHFYDGTVEDFAKAVHRILSEYESYREKALESLPRIIEIIERQKKDVGSLVVNVLGLNGSHCEGTNSV